MGNKVNLAMQNQFVEFAKKDGEGNDIAEAIEQLQQAISGVVAFDGTIKTTSGPSTYIANADRPTSSGIYKILYSTGGNAGVINFQNGSGYVVGFYQNYVFAGQWGSTADFVFAEHKYPTGTKLYEHELVKTNSSDHASYTIVSNTETLSSSSNILSCTVVVNGSTSTPFTSSNQPLFAKIVSAGGTYLKMMYWDSTDSKVKTTDSISLYNLSTFTDTVTPL